MAFSSRDEGYDIARAYHLIFSGDCIGTTGSKGLRTALQMVVIILAGYEVATMGPMHADEKHVAFAGKIQAHKEKLTQDLQALGVKTGVPFPEQAKDAINYTNANKNPFVVAPNAASWKKIHKGLCADEARADGMVENMPAEFSFALWHGTGRKIPGAY